MFFLGSCSADVVPQVHPQLDFQVRLDVRTASSTWRLGRGLESPGAALGLPVDCVLEYLAMDVCA
jgi:hypothetical protein